MRFLHAEASLIVALVLTLVGSTFARANPTTRSEETSVRREKVICGPNAVYALLSAYGFEVSGSLIDELVPTHPGGMSLSEVRDALAKHGMPATIRQCEPSDLAGAVTPYIAYLKFEVSGGHYLVVLSQSNGGAHVLDPTTGATFTTPLEKLLTASNGYIIIPQVNSTPVRTFGAYAVLAAIAFFGCCRFRRASHCLLLAAVLASAPSALASSAPSPPRSLPQVPGSWRTNANSGINCLWLVLRGAGRTVDYAELLKQGNIDATCVDGLAKLAACHGFKLAPVRLKFTELQSTTGPLILFMEPEGIGSGTFALLVATSGDKVSYLEGASIRWIQQDRSDFLRAWSGYALVRVPVRSQISVGVGALVLIAVIGAAWCIVRWLSPITRITLLILPPLFFVNAPVEASEPPEPKLPEQIRQALMRNANQIAPLSVSWIHERSKTASAISSIGQPVGIDVEHDELRLTVQDSMFYTRTDRHTGSDILEHSFNGVTYFIGRPPVSGAMHQPSLTKLDVRWLAARDPDAPWFAAAYFDIAGFEMPKTSAELKGHTKLQSRIVKLLDHDAKLVSCDDVALSGMSCTRVELEVKDADAIRRRGGNSQQVQQAADSAEASEESTREYRAAVDRRFALPAKKRLIFFLDPRRDYCVVRYEERKVTGPALLISIAEGWRNVRGTLWLPQYCRIMHYATEEALFLKPVTLGTIRVTSMDAQPQPIAMFTLSYSAAGTKIHEQGADGRRESYEVPATPADLNKAIARARDAGFLRGPGGPSRHWWFFVASGAVLTVAAGILTLRTHRPWRKGPGTS